MQFQKRYDIVSYHHQNGSEYGIKDIHTGTIIDDFLYQGMPYEYDFTAFVKAVDKCRVMNLAHDDLFLYTSEIYIYLWKDIN